MRDGDADARVDGTLSQGDFGLTVLQVLPALHQGGVERGTVEIDNALAERGWTSLVASSGGPMTAQLRGTHFTLPVERKRWVSIIRNAFRLASLIRAQKVDIVHARSRAPAWAAFLAAKMTGARFVTTFHGEYGLGGRFRMFYNSAMVRGDRIIAVSDFIESHILAHYGVDPARITVIHRGADLRVFRPVAAKSNAAPPSSRPVVMLPGRVSRWKGQHIFIEAMRYVDARGVIVGDTEDHAYEAELRASLPANVTMRKGTIDMPRTIDEADVVVSASIRAEAFGRVAIEAQAMGKPVVATRLGGALETVLHGETGLLVPPGDVDAMAEAITRLLENPLRYRAACLCNAQRFSARSMCDRELELYADMMNSSR